MEFLTTDKESSKMTAEALQAMWKEHLGATIKIKQMEWTSYITAMFDKDYDLAAGGWIGDYMDPLTFLDMWMKDGGNNRTGWHNEEFEDILGKAAQTGDPSKRYALLAQAEALFLRERPILPVYWYTRNYLLHPDVKGWSPCSWTTILTSSCVWNQDRQPRKIEAMFRFLIGRLFQGMLVLLALYTITFFLAKAMPGEPFTSEKKNAWPRPRPTSASSMVWTNPFGNSTSFIPRTSSRKVLSVSPRARGDQWATSSRNPSPTPSLGALRFGIRHRNRRTHRRTFYVAGTVGSIGPAWPWP